MATTSLELLIRVTSIDATRGLNNSRTGRGSLFTDRRQRPTEDRTQISLTLSAACVVSQTVGSFPLSKDPAAYQSIGVLPNAGRDERRVQCVLCDRTFV